MQGIELVMEECLCYLCFSCTHRLSECRHRIKYDIEGCLRYHSRLLHSRRHRQTRGSGLLEEERSSEPSLLIVKRPMSGLHRRKVIRPLSSDANYTTNTIIKSRAPYRTQECQSAEIQRGKQKRHRKPWPRHTMETRIRRRVVFNEKGGIVRRTSKIAHNWPTITE